MHFLLAALLLAVSSDVRTSQKPPRDPRTAGLGKSCKKNGDCKHGSQRCVQQSDANGKPLNRAFCVLPCASFEAGTQRALPGGAWVSGVRGRGGGGGGSGGGVVAGIR